VLPNLSSPAPSACALGWHPIRHC